jgi:hypothetical protein
VQRLVPELQYDPVQQGLPDAMQLDPEAMQLTQLWLCESHASWVDTQGGTGTGQQDIPLAPQPMQAPVLSQYWPVGVQPGPQTVLQVGSLPHTRAPQFGTHCERSGEWVIDRSETARSGTAKSGSP